ncbi:MAG: HIT domain-containing protein [Candidatus Omnitrophica bacterium]|nr:HIT domain-containing protein [Candidatus Omnitrophota bacterium]MBU0881510.1 HIT domain-containing protein [Candidatus Omnitrophota bacterium]MBU0894971.1 HIT domain-containing protein [Candidatus Omnitrophota bacterium]MBU1037998.1 HIT domain-containing protein [Candidatus Omnitrophota bacterium]MBU1809439.1 HIT domain-containing protein [Candidatus Omnitrophota bacterium]
MNKLWAPWRSKYIYLRKRSGCIFCLAKKAKNLKKLYILERSAHSFSMLNLYPYNNGHVMVAPYRHVKSLELLSDEELLDMIKLINKAKVIIDKRLKPHGFNIGLNVGKVAGAGFAGHIHAHIVPRWTGDTNFMPLIGGTRVMPESLDSLYELLRER